MWELIRANRRRSMVLVVVMLFILLLLGFILGGSLAPLFDGRYHDGYEYQAGDPIPGWHIDVAGGLIGMGFAFVLWAGQTFAAYFFGGKILLAVSHATPIRKEDHPQLWNVVEEMTIASRLPKMPAVYIMDDMGMNAFATGRDPEHAAVAVTAGLLGRLNRDELQGVIAHEIAHIKNRDVLFMTMVGIMVGTIVMISDVFLRTLWYGSLGRSRRYSSSKKDSGAGIIVILLVAIVVAILAPILARMIYFAISRRREYLADASAAVFTRYPEGLASALEAISKDTNRLRYANKVTAPMFIINPLHKEGKMALNLTSTHPPITERIKVLRSMAGGVSFAKYQEAWQKAQGRKAGHLPASALAEQEQPIRTAKKRDEQENEQTPRQRMREAGDLLRKVNEYVFLACVCGMRFKLPPDFKHDHVDCPRCRRNIEVPAAQMATAAAVGSMMSSDGDSQEDKNEFTRGAVMAGMLANRATPQRRQAQGIPTAKARQHQETQQAQTSQQASGQPFTVNLKPNERGWSTLKCPCGAVRNIGPSFQAKQTRCTRCGRHININFV